MRFKQIGLIALSLITFLGCKDDNITEEEVKPYDYEVEEQYEFGYNLNNFNVVRDTIRKGDTFGTILERNNIDFPKIYQIAEKAKDTFDIRKLQIGKPYTILKAKDSKEPQSFIYQPTRRDYVVIEFCDSLIAYKEKKPVTIVEKEAH